MTLDEHIKKAEEDAERAEFDTEWGIGNYFIDRTEALEYAKECRNLAEWLKDYKRLLDAIDDIKAEIEQHCSITVGSDNEPAMTLHDIFGILDKHISRKETE